ncbi:MAG: NAD(+) synthase [Bacillota bacterium]
MSGSLTEQLARWLREQVEQAGARGVVVGLSGGIDSAVVAGLGARALGPERVLGLILPCHSDPVDAEYARMVAEAFGIPCETVDLTPAYDALAARLTRAGEGTEVRKLALANLKPRLRMATLYFYAQLHGYLVAGTSNRSELYVGYFTKWGDSGADLLPIGGLVKEQVRAVARELGVPQPIIDRVPTAGLWPGQTDEGQMGVTYRDLDQHILGGPVDPGVAERIEAMHRASAHKRRLPPIGPTP